MTKTFLAVVLALIVLQPARGEVPLDSREQAEKKYPDLALKNTALRDAGSRCMAAQGSEPSPPDIGGYL